MAAPRASSQRPELDKRLRGEVIRPGDDACDEARRVWNAAVDRRPALIVRPRDVDDVIAAVEFTRINDHQSRCAAVDTVRPGFG